MALLEDFSTFLSLARRQDAQFDPNLHNNSKAPTILSVSGFFSGIAVLVVLFRFYVRLFIVRKVSTDDYFVLFALICGIFLVVTLVSELKHGLGRYTQYLSIANHAALVKISYFHFLILGLGLSAVKISFGLFLLKRLQRGKAYSFVKLLIICLWIMLVVHTSIHLFRCIPVSAGWSLTQRDTAKCISRRHFMILNMAMSGVHAAIDGCFVTLCVLLFNNLQRTVRYRLLFFGMIAFGFVTCFAAIIKASMSVYALRVKVKYRGNDYGLWAFLEYHLAIISASLPTLGPLFRNLLSPTSVTDPEITTDTYTRRRTHHFDAASTSKSQQIPLYPVRRGSNDFDKDPGNRAGTCKYQVEVSAAPRKRRTSSFSVYRHTPDDGNCEVGDAIATVPAAVLARENPTRPFSSQSNGIMLRTDVYVRMEDALEEESEEADPERATKRSKWSC